jgi:hypothetical protein
VINRQQKSPWPNRREVLRAGLVGFTGLALPDLFRLRTLSAAGKNKSPTAVILVWLRGGASHLETFDPKPDAPSGYRGPYAACDTNIPGIRIGELLPQLAKIADKYALLRSMAHTGGGHPAGSLQVLGGDPDPQDKDKAVFPDWMSVVNYLRHDPTRSLSNYVAINPVDHYDGFGIAGPCYLGPAYEAFRVIGDPNQPSFEVPNIGLSADQHSGLKRRLDLRSSLDRLRRTIDSSGKMAAVDQFETQAINMLTSPAAQAAFDLSALRARGKLGRSCSQPPCLRCYQVPSAVFRPGHFRPH